MGQRGPASDLHVCVQKLFMNNNRTLCVRPIFSPEPEMRFWLVATCICFGRRFDQSACGTARSIAEGSEQCSLTRSEEA